MRPPRTVLLALTSLLLAWPVTAAPGQAQDPPAPPASTPGAEPPHDAALDALLARTTARTGASVIDLDTGRAVYGHDQHGAYTPASVRKLLSMSAVLYTLRPNYWFSTDVTGAEPDPQGLVPNLTLSGIGDPSVTTLTLTRLARQVRARGIRAVGSITVNEAAFAGGGWTPPGGTTTAPIALERSDDEGFAPTTDEDAALEAGRAFVRALSGAGVRVTGAVTRANVRLNHGLATQRSAPLAQLIARTLRPSDNVYAEQLFARLGMNVNASVPGSAARALEWERRFLERAGVNTTNLTLVDASGLASDNRVTPRAITDLLKYTYATAPDGRPAGRAAYLNGTNAFIEALPRAGTGTATPGAAARGGTLATRLHGLDVRAKTGTLIGTSALAGYVRARSGHVLAFAILMDDYDGPARDLRAVQDAFVRELAARSRSAAQPTLAPAHGTLD